MHQVAQSGDQIKHVASSYCYGHKFRIQTFGHDQNCLKALPTNWFSLWNILDRRSE